MFGWIIYLNNTQEVLLRQWFKQQIKPVYGVDRVPVMQSKQNTALWLHEGNVLNKLLKQLNVYSYLVDQHSLEHREKICESKRQIWIPERRELVNWNYMNDVFRTALVESNSEKHKYGSYPYKLNDKTPLIMNEERYSFFVMLVVWKHLTNVNQTVSFFKRN